MGNKFFGRTKYSQAFCRSKVPFEIFRVYTVRRKKEMSKINLRFINITENKQKLNYESSKMSVISPLYEGSWDRMVS